LRNGRQLYEILAATFGIPAATEPLSEQLCSAPSTEAEGLACAWKSLQSIATAALAGSSIDEAWFDDIAKVCGCVPLSICVC